MEDEYFANQNGSFVTVCDGHGGRAVARYLRQNLYARYLQAFTQEAVDNKNTSEKDQTSEINEMNNIPIVKKEVLSRQQNVNHQQDEKDASIEDHQKTMNTNISSGDTPLVVQTCISALKCAFEKVDAEVQQISHWSYQGSTACTVLFCDVVASDSSLSSYSPHSPSLSALGEQSIDREEETINSYLIAANVGDSRAVLSRSGHAVELTKDHKPNDPLERKRVENLGGEVRWCGPVHPKTGKPIIRSKKNGKYGVNGVYRINGNLALSRAIGDRSERPLVSSHVDIKYFKLDDKQDEFVILASDGLWDVFTSSQDVIDFCHNVLGQAAEEKRSTQNKTQMKYHLKKMDGLAQIIVEEALRRGSMDNISAVVISLK